MSAWSPADFARVARGHSRRGTDTHVPTPARAVRTVPLSCRRCGTSSSDVKRYTLRAHSAAPLCRDCYAVVTRLLCRDTAKVLEAHEYGRFATVTEALTLDQPPSTGELAPPLATMPPQPLRLFRMSCADLHCPHRLCQLAREIVRIERTPCTVCAQPIGVGVLYAAHYDPLTHVQQLAHYLCAPYTQIQRWEHQVSCDR